MYGPPVVLFNAAIDFSLDSSDISSATADDSDRKKAMNFNSKDMFNSSESAK